MSDPKEIKMNLHHSGQFISDNGKLKFTGVVEELTVEGIGIFEEIIMKICTRVSLGKMWYKLPFEELEDRKALWENVDVSKRKMNSAGRWMGELDFFVEKITDEDAQMIIEGGDGNREGGQRAGDGNREEEDGTVNIEEEDAHGLGDGNREEEDAHRDGAVNREEEDAQADVGAESEDLEEFKDSDESDNEYDVGMEEDLELFNQGNYEDEIPDEDEVHPDTENSSDDEEEQADRMAQRGQLDGVFSLRQTFYSGAEFKRQVIKYILKTRRNVVYDRWEKTKIGAKCGGKGCQWRIYCSVERPIKKWMVKVYINQHTCHPTGKCKLIKSPAIADVMFEDVKKNPDMSAPLIQEEFRKRYNIIISTEQARSTRRIALDNLQVECNEHFARLRDYEMELLRSNEGSIIEINTTTKENGAKAFKSMYICFKALKDAWKKNCRPVIGLDGTFLKHNSLQGMILTAIGRDPNNQIFPVAWSVVSSENHDNWEWFIHRLKVDLDLGLGENMTMISDQHRSLIHGVAVVLPLAEHRACARHIYSNLKKNHKSDTLKPLFWRVASSYNEADFDKNLAVFREFDARACDELMQKDPRTWCRAFFRVGSCCADTHNNFTESFNRTLKIARKKPFVQILELIRRDAMQRVANRFKTASQEVGIFTKKARKETEKSCDEAQNCYSISSTGGDFEIVEFGNGYKVSLPSRSCACRKWDLTGIPCRHGVSAIRENGMDVHDFISDYYLTAKWQDLYSNGLKPVNGPKFWKISGAELIEAPPYKRPPGRPKGKARIKGKHESPKKNQTKVGRGGRIGHCGLCGEERHNSRKCPHESEECRAKRRRLREGPQDEQQDIEDISSTAPPPTQSDV